MRVWLVGGFLGAGKTSLLQQAALLLRARGERVAVVTNDQGGDLVDTVILRAPGVEVTEIAGGCVCCRYGELRTALSDLADAGTTIALVEAVGSCTDLVATVLGPLADQVAGRIELGPLAVVVDPDRLLEHHRGEMGPEVGYLFSKQLEEADVVLLSRGDEDNPDVSRLLRELSGNAPVLRVSGRSGVGVDEWLSFRPERWAAPLSIDYDRYAAGEAALAWFNGRVRITAPTPTDFCDVARHFLCGLRHLRVAHAKLASPNSATEGKATLVRRGGEPDVRLSSEPAPSVEWLVNARVELAPEELSAALVAALADAAPGLEIAWLAIESFAPARPVPQHRYAARCPTGAETACCAAFYARPDVSALLGESWHPGGLELTLTLADSLDLAPGARVLDVACGAGASLHALAERFGIAGVGLDAQPATTAQPGCSVHVGDAHAIPFPAASFDALLCECALSTFHDQRGALREMARVLVPGGRVGLSDMVVEGELPPALASIAHRGACLGGALSNSAYLRLLEEAGLQLREQRDVSDALQELLRRIKRNLVGAALASAHRGTEPPFDVKEARSVLRAAESAVANGQIRYALFVAERRAFANEARASVATGLP